jgi:hypothetical protein
MLRRRAFVWCLLAGLSVPAIAVAAEATSIMVRGQRIALGTTSDEVVAILSGKTFVVDTQVRKDPRNSRSLEVTHAYNVEGMRFSLVLTRVVDPGPYVVSKIVVAK